MSMTPSTDNNKNNNTEASSFNLERKPGDLDQLPLIDRIKMLSSSTDRKRDLFDDESDEKPVKATVSSDVPKNISKIKTQMSTDGVSTDNLIEKLSKSSAVEKIVPNVVASPPVSKKPKVVIDKPEETTNKAKGKQPVANGKKKSVTNEKLAEPKKTETKKTVSKPKADAGKKTAITSSETAKLAASVKSISSTSSLKSTITSTTTTSLSKPSKATSSKSISSSKSSNSNKSAKVSPSSQENEEVESGNDEEFKWWEQENLANNDGTVKWDTLEHNGPYFPPPYEPINIPLIYEGKELYLEPEAEEIAGFFGALLQSDHAKNSIFVANFFEDFQKVLKEVNSRHVHTITSFERCDFGLFLNYFEAQREQKKAASKAEKESLKEAKKRIDEHFGFCLLDGRKEKVGNFKIEPPGLFRGRGKHPKAGKLKWRVQPEQVTINIGHGATVPQPPPGHDWASVLHDNTVTWLATWTENVNKNQKYVFLAPGSSLKGQSDLKKFEVARKLKDYVTQIRKKNAEELHSKDMLTRQRATALWLIDHLALRAGNEKGDDEADTVGCCSLRVEHVTLKPPTTLVLDFLGKDSIRYFRELDSIDPQIIKNLGIFMKNKQPEDSIFDHLNTNTLNKYLSELMPGLTAKVFRTFNASSTFQKELDAGTKSEFSDAEKVLAYNRANRQVAILCNHQRSIPKTHSQAMERLQEKFSFLQLQRWHARKGLMKMVSNKAKIQLKEEELQQDAGLDVKSITELFIEREKERLDKQNEKQNSQETSKSDKKPKTKKEVQEAVKEQLDKLSNPNSEEQARKKYATLSDRLSSLRLQMTDRDENKTTALGTSKTNYIDPRITAAWCSAHGVSIEKMFNKSLREKFKWAMNVDPDWKF